MLDITFVCEGKSKDFVDIELASGDILRDVPYFDKNGAVIGYDEAITLYGFTELADGIWDDPEYIGRIESYINA